MYNISQLPMLVLNLCHPDRGLLQTQSVGEPFYS